MSARTFRWQKILWGGYGRGNTGDDLTLAIAMADAVRAHGEAVAVLAPDVPAVRRVLPRAQIISCSKPTGWFRRFGTFALAHQFPRLGACGYRHGCPRHPADALPWPDAIAAARTLHLVGGGYLTDHFDLENFLPPLRLAAALQLPITSSPIGLGPFASAAKARQVAQTLRGAELQVRDEASLEFCRKHGLSAVERPDDGFRWREVVNFPLPGGAGPGAGVIGVCIFGQYTSQWSDTVEAWWVTCLQTLARTLPGYRLEGFCFHTQPAMDYETTRRLFARAGLNPDHVQPPQPDFRAAIQNLTHYQAILSTRFHAVVTASGMPMPCVAMALDDYYETKMRGALKHAPTPLSLVNPLRDPPQAAAHWLAQWLGWERQNPPPPPPAPR